MLIFIKTMKDLILKPLFFSVGILTTAGVLNACIDEINTRYQHQYLTYCQDWFNILIFLSQLILNVYVTIFYAFITIPFTISQVFRNNINTIQIFNSQYYDSYTYGCVCALILSVYLICRRLSTIDAEPNIKTTNISKGEIFSTQPGLESIGDLPDVDTLEIDIEKPDVKIIKPVKVESNDPMDSNVTEEEVNNLIDPNVTEEEVNNLIDSNVTEEEPNDPMDSNVTEEEPNDLIEPMETRVTWAEPVETNNVFDELLDTLEHENKDNKLQFIIHNAKEYYIDEKTNKVYTDDIARNLVGKFTKDGKLVLVNQSHLIKEEF